MPRTVEIAPGLSVQHGDDGYWLVATGPYGEGGMISTATMLPVTREAFEAVIERLLGGENSA